MHICNEHKQFEPTFLVLCNLSYMTFQRVILKIQKGCVCTT